MIERTMIALSSPLSGCWQRDENLAVDFDGGGKPVVMKRSDPFLSTIFFSRLCTSFVA